MYSYCDSIVNEITRSEDLNVVLSAKTSHLSLVEMNKIDSVPDDTDPPKKSRTRSNGSLCRNNKIGELNCTERISRSMILLRRRSSLDCFIRSSHSLDTMLAKTKDTTTENEFSKSRFLEIEPGFVGSSFVDDDAAFSSEGSKYDNSEMIMCKTGWAAADAVISSLVVAPLVVISWHGLWKLMDTYPDVFPEIATGICGLVIHTSFTILRELLQNREANSKDKGNTILMRGSSRFYCWLFLASCVSHWRGCWAVWPGVAIEGHISVARMIVCLTSLIVLRSTRNLITVPFFVQLDSPGRTYYFYTRFRKSSREPLLYLLDCLFSVIVVGSLVVFVWRGAWDLLDVYLFPQDRALSAWASFLLGYGLAIVTFLLQGAAKRACTKLKGAQRLLVADLFLLLSFISTINVWRSIWSLLDLYFLPENPELSNWITHGGCFLLLMLLNCANSALVRGVYIDAEEDGGQCVVFPCYYLRLFFQKERIKKRKKMLEVAASEKLDLEAPGIEPLLMKSSGPMPVIVKTTTLPVPSNHMVVHLSPHNDTSATEHEPKNHNSEK